MVSLYKFIGESLAPHHLKTLAEFLTNIKAWNFVGFALPFKLPLDASKYTRMELEVFTPAFDRKGLGKFMSYSKLSGSDRIIMNHFIEFVLSVFDSTGKISNTEPMYRLVSACVEFMSTL